MDCIFCKIVAGEIPCYKIYEDDKTIAFLDIACDYVGHTLVLAKEHCNNILDASSEILGSVMSTVQRVSNHYIGLGYDGVNVLINNNSSAEQSVYHLHVHIIPRREGDGLCVFPTRDSVSMDLSKIHSSHKLV